MKEDDYLNFILFSTHVTTWKDSLVQATPANLEEARMFVKNIRDEGSKLAQLSILPIPFPASVTHLWHASPLGKTSGLKTRHQG